MAGPSSALLPLMGLMFLMLAGTTVMVAIAMGFGIATYSKDTDSLTRTRVFVNGTSCYAGEARRKAAYRLRELTAYEAYSVSVPCHVDNGDDALYPASRLGSYSKGLQHNSLGVVDPGAYWALLQAVSTGLCVHYDMIPLAGPRKLVNPQAGLSFALLGADTQSYYMPPSPAFSSRAFAHELAENYWMSLTRDVPFADYATNALTVAAAQELSSFSEYGGPMPVMPGVNLFRGKTMGCSIGPYISQFLYLPCWVGTSQISQKLFTPTSGVDFMTTWTEFLAIQNGQLPTQNLTLSPGTGRYIINGRDLARWVHVDYLFQGYLHALYILMKMKVPLKASIPYQMSSTNQAGFATFGEAEIGQMLTEVSNYALRATWHQKWQVHRKLRPEAAAGSVDRTKASMAAFPLHADILNSVAVGATKTKHGTWLLSQAFPEGSPLHPSYAAGHAAIAGACVTVLKFWYKEDFVIPMPMVPDANGTMLMPYTGPPLAVGGELDKLANNAAMGRNIAGIHWRSDTTASLKLGEEVAVAMLREKKRTVNEPMGTWTATGFDGTLLIV